jgi:PrgI family protein
MAPIPTTAVEPVRYEFPPPESGSVALGLSMGQLAIVVGALLGVITALRVGVPVWLAVVLAAPIVGFGVWRRRGEPLTALSVRWVTWALRPRRSRHGPLATRARLAGDGAAERVDVPPPDWARHLQLVEVPYGDGRTVGVWRDGDAYVTVLSVTPSATALRDIDEQDGLLANWGELVASAGVEGSPVQRLGWTARTSPDEGADAAAYVRDNGDESARLVRPTLWRSYLEVGDAAGTTSAAHELLVVVRVQPDRARHRVRAAGRNRTARELAGAVLAVEETERIGHRLIELGCHLEGLFTPEALAAVVRTTFDPSARADLARWRGASGDADAGVNPASGMWPLSHEEPADHVRTDGGYHRLYWIEEWPTIPVTATWMHPLLLRSTVQRTVTMVMEPVATDVASRAAHRARSSARSEADVRERHGFLSSARSERALLAAEQREQELVDGHRDVRFAGYVAVTARSLPELEDACATTIYEAGRARLRLRPLHGEHWPALAAVLPLGRFLW